MKHNAVPSLFAGNHVQTDESTLFDTQQKFPIRSAALFNYAKGDITRMHLASINALQPQVRLHKLKLPLDTLSQNCTSEKFASPEESVKNENASQVKNINVCQEICQHTNDCSFRISTDIKKSNENNLSRSAVISSDKSIVALAPNINTSCSKSIKSKVRMTSNFIPELHVEPCIKKPFTMADYVERTTPALVSSSDFIPNQAELIKNSHQKIAPASSSITTSNLMKIKDEPIDYGK